MRPIEILESDPNLKVCLDWHGSTPSPARNIWRAQHQCVSEEFVEEEPAPTERQAGERIVKVLLQSRGHYEPLRWAHCSFFVRGFPHDTVMQLVRHQDSAHLVQSLRSTGGRLCNLQYPLSQEELEELFYAPPPGVYRSREGEEIEYSQELRNADLRAYGMAAQTYCHRISAGYPKELARRGLPFAIRQNYTISADLRAILHLLDQRTKADTQLEARALAEGLLQGVEEFVPEVGAFYRSNRYGRARLAP